MPPPEPEQRAFESLFDLVDEVVIEGTEEASLTSAFDVEVTPAAIYVVSPRGNRVFKYDRGGGFQGRIGGAGPGPGEFELPLTAVSDRDGNLYVTDYRHRRVLIFDHEDEFVRDFPFQGQGHLLLLTQEEGGRPMLATVGLVGETLIQLFDAEGRSARKFDGLGTDWPFRGWAATTSDSGEFFIINHVQQDLHQFGSDGSLQRTISLSSPSLVRFTGYDLEMRRERTRADAVETFRLLRSEKHTRIENIAVTDTLILIGIRRYQFEEGVAADALDVYDIEGNLLYYGMSAPGRVKRFAQEPELVYFIDIDKSGDNYGVVTLRSYRLRPAG